MAAPLPPLLPPTIGTRSQKLSGVMEQTKGCRLSHPNEVFTAGKCRHEHPMLLGILHHTHTEPRERANNTSPPGQSIMRLISLASIKHSDAVHTQHKALLNSHEEQSQQCLAFVYVRYSADTIPLGNSNSYGYNRGFSTTSTHSSNTDHTYKSNLRNVWSTGNLTLSHLQACQCLPFSSAADFCKRHIHNFKLLTSEPNPASIQDIQEKRLS